MRLLPAPLLLALLLLVAALPAAQAQLQVNISLKRSLYVSYEPLIINVQVHNLSGNSLHLRDSDSAPWFGFQIETLDGRPVRSRSSRYTNPPILIPAGGKISRAVNLTPLFSIGEFGGYRVRANIHDASRNQYHTSPPLTFEITEGRPVFQKTVGVPAHQPGGGGAREISVMTHRLPASTQLYLRITDATTGNIYCTHRLGRILSHTTPQIELDASNRIHILQNVAPKALLYSHIGLNGEVLDRKTYNQTGKRPGLKKTADGGFQVVGAALIDPAAAAALAEQPTPSLSDRPVPLPTGAATPPPDLPRPKNLLSR
jgi:hypothetical protein